MSSIDVTELRVALVRKGLRQWEASAAIGYEPSFMSAVLNGRAQEPASMRKKLEKYLELPDGSLLKKPTEA